MPEIDYSKLGKSIADSMASDGHIKNGVTQIISPMLERHKKDTVEEIQKMAIGLGVDCSDPINNQKDFAHLRDSRLRNESNVNKVKDWALRAAIVVLFGWVGFDVFK